MIFPVPGLGGKDVEGQGGTRQVRITFQNPAVQTYPKNLLATIRSRFPGGTIWKVDLKAIELVVAGLLSGEPALLRIADPTYDPHTARAIELFGPAVLTQKYGTDFRSNSGFEDNERQVGKGGNFGDLFLASPQTMRNQVFALSGKLLPLDPFVLMADTRPVSRPVLWEWQYTLCRQAQANRLLELPLTGESRHFPGFSVDAEAWRSRRLIVETGEHHLNEVVNFPVQGTTANLVLAIQHEFGWRLLDIGRPQVRPLMFLQIYDSVWVDCPPGTRPQVETAWNEACAVVSSPTGFWGQLQSRLGRTMPFRWKTN